MTVKLISSSLPEPPTFPEPGVTMPIFDALELYVLAFDPLPTEQEIDHKIDRSITAAVDGGLDLLLAADGRALVEQARRAKGMHDRLVAGIPEVVRDPMYVAGRIGALTDMLGLAAERCAPSRFEEILRQERFASLLRALLDGAARNVELIERVGESKEGVCRKLRELKEIGAVASSKHGREVVNVLLPAARAFLIAERGGVEVDESTFDLDVFQGLPSPWIDDVFVGGEEDVRVVFVPRLALADNETVDEAGVDTYAEAA